MTFSLCSAFLFIALSVSGPATPVDAASEGFQPWFPCGMRYWTPCQRPARAPRLPAGDPSPEPQQPTEPALSPTELTMWGTPVVGPSGTVSYQLPPKPLLDLFRQPGDDTARAYLQVWKDKAGRREEAFAAIRRVADELGFEHGAGALSDPTSTLAPAPALSSPELSAIGAAGSLPSLLDDARPSVRHEQTPMAATPVGTWPPVRPQTVTAVASTTPPSVIHAAMATTETPGQQTRVFYFFSPRCPYCAQQTPLLNALVQGRHDVVGIAMDTDRDELLAHVRQMHMTFPVTLDQGESKTFGVTAYPTLVVLDAAGKATRLQGLVTRSDLQRMIGGGT